MTDTEHWTLFRDVDTGQIRGVVGEYLSGPHDQRLEKVDVVSVSPNGDEPGAVDRAAAWIEQQHVLTAFDADVRRDLARALAEGTLEAARGSG